MGQITEQRNQQPKSPPTTATGQPIHREWGVWGKAVYKPRCPVWGTVTGNPVGSKATTTSGTNESSNVLNQNVTVGAANWGTVIVVRGNNQIVAFLQLNQQPSKRVGSNVMCNGNANKRTVNEGTGVTNVTNVQRPGPGPNNQRKITTNQQR